MTAPKTTKPTPLAFQTQEEARVDIERSAQGWLLKCHGDWRIGTVNTVNKELSEIDITSCKNIIIDTNSVSGFDTAGAWLVERFRIRSKDLNIDFTHIDTNPKHTGLVTVIRQQDPQPLGEETERKNRIAGPFEALGRAVAGFGRDAITGIMLIIACLRGASLKKGRRGGIRFISIIHHVEQMGLRSVPVIAVMSFLIGAIIAQQGAYQLKFFGEELLTIDLVSILHFREIGVLLTAIMVAGRSGSAITAEIGTMKMREEIDALTVIGLNPVAILILPRLIALIISLPILVLLSDIAGIAGAVVVSDLYVGIPPVQFLTILQGEISTDHIWVGLIKAPFMAIIVGMSAAIEGLKVGGSAESLGQRTTSAVVRAIFAVIVMDGLFAIFFASIGL